MSYYSRLNKAFEDALRLPLNQHTKYVLFSDCHRGVGTTNDNFLKNQNLYFAALQHYFRLGYTYIELGDGDELWENRSMRQIIEAHGDIFSLLSRFHCQGRLYMLYGNHDMTKKDRRYTVQNCSTYPCCCGNNPHLECSPLLPDIKFHQGIILEAADLATTKNVYLAHGHQALYSMALFPFSGSFSLETLRALRGPGPNQRRQELYEKAENRAAPASLGRTGKSHPNHRTHAPPNLNPSRYLLL